MPRSVRLEDKLDMLASLARELPSEAARDEFKKALLGTNNVITARSAQLIARAGDQGLIPTLIDAFTDLLKKPYTSDKGCWAKNAILEALNDLEYEWYEPFLLGVTYKQMEPAYEVKIDTAADLRANCLVSLANRNYPDLNFIIADMMLFDIESNPRLAAVSILATGGDETSELLLRIKASLTEKDDVVMQKCFAGLLATGSDRSWDLVASFLASKDQVTRESAALAMGDSHNQRAVPILKATFEETFDFEFKRMLLLGMVLSRTDEAIDYIINILKSAATPRAMLALEALSIYSGDEKICQRVSEIVVFRDDPEIQAAYNRKFGKN